MTLDVLDPQTEGIALLAGFYLGTYVDSWIQVASPAVIKDCQGGNHRSPAAKLRNRRVRRGAGI